MHPCSLAATPFLTLALVNGHLARESESAQARKGPNNVVSVDLSGGEWDKTGNGEQSEDGQTNERIISEIQRTDAQENGWAASWHVAMEPPAHASAH
jgi:hypothetical protein